MTKGNLEKSNKKQQLTVSYNLSNVFLLVKRLFDVICCTFYILSALFFNNASSLQFCYQHLRIHAKNILLSVLSPVNTEVSTILFQKLSIVF